MRNNPCSFAYASTSAICSVAAIRHPQIIQRLHRRSGTRRWSRHTREPCCAIVARSARLNAIQPVAVKFDELADHALLAQHLRDGQHQVGRRRAFGQLARQLEPDHFRQQHRRGWPSMHASASIPPTPQPTTPRPLIIVVCESVPTTVSGYASPSMRHHHRRQIFQVHLMHDARIRRHHAEILKRRLPPPQERIALLIALEFDAARSIENASFVPN